MLVDDRFVIHSETMVDEETLHVSYSENSEMHSGNNKTNVIIASFVTAQGRLKLYEELRKINERVLYCDTDSIIFITREGEYEPKLGNLLGQLTSELDENEYIIEFVSTGSKSYGYITNSGKTECTCKGFSFNFDTEEAINFESMKKIVTEDNYIQIKVPQFKFLRNKDNWTVFTKEQEKVMSFTFNKRVVKDNYFTIPFGYVK